MMYQKSYFLMYTSKFVGVYLIQRLRAKERARVRKYRKEKREQVRG